MQEHSAILVTALSFLFPVEAVAQVPGDRQPDPPAPNILVIVADDIGVDVLSVYDEGYEEACNSFWLEDHDECDIDDDCPGDQTCVPNYPPTPTINSLAEDGILFRNAWSCPTCSPTRATIQTGRYSFRTGVLFAAAFGELFGENDLPEWEITIPEAFALAGSQYATAAIGKWHLGGKVTGTNGHGYSHFAGTASFLGCVNPSSFYVWPRTEGNGDDEETTETCYNYATTQNVDDAVAWLDQQTGPWFMYLAFNAAHAPYHAPPGWLHSYHGVDRPDLPWASILYAPFNSHNCLCPWGSRDYRYCYQADVEAMDREMGRLLDWLEQQQQLSDTTIIFVGDNGTPGWPAYSVTAPPFNPWRAKARVYEGGINVPLIIRDPRYPNPAQNQPRISDALVNTTDLFATVLDLAGIDPEDVITDRPIDSVSLMPIIEDSTSGSLRDYVYSEQYLVGLYEQTIRNVGGYKLIHMPYKPVNRYELYYLPDDRWEENDLYRDWWPPDPDSEEGFNFDDLKAQMEDLVRSVSPPDGESCQPTSGTLEWPMDLQAVGYWVQIGTECGTGPESDVTDPHYVYSGLQRDTIYYWRVKPEYESGTGTYSRCYSFITAPETLPPPTLLIPANGATGQRPLGILDWSDVSGALGYRVQIGTACGTGPESDVTGSECGYSELEADTTHYWRVKTEDICGQYGDYSTCFSFEVVPEPDINCEDLEGHYFAWSEPGDYSLGHEWQIVNEGGAPLQGQVVLSDGDCGHFEVTQGLGEFGPLAPDESRTVEARFRPTSEGRKECVLQITSNDPDESPCEVLLTGDCGINLWGNGTDGDVTLDPGDPDVCDPDLSESDVCVLMRDMQFHSLFVPAGIKLDTHAYTVRVYETLLNYGEITDNWSGGPGGPGGAGGVGRNGKGAPNDPTGCGRVHAYCTGGADGTLGDEPLVWQPDGEGYGGRGGGGGGGGGASWHLLTANDADGGNGGVGGTGGKGGGYVKVYARRLDNRNRIHADGHLGGAGGAAPRGDEGVVHEPADPYGYWHCGAEYWLFTFFGLKDVAGGGGGGGGGGQGGHGGTLEVRYAQLLNEASMTWAGGPGGPGGAGGSEGGCCTHTPFAGGCSNGCSGGAPGGGTGGRGGHAGGSGDCGSCGEEGVLGPGGPSGELGRDDIEEDPDCLADPDCDDGLYCNGVEQCDSNICVPGTPPDCSDGLDCTDDWCCDVTGACRHDVKPGHCLIGGSCHVAGTVNSANECEECNPLLSTSAWSPRSAGVQCGDWDSSPCDYPDTCDGAGVCQPNHLPDGSPCDDGLFCNGAETCVSGYCQPGEPLIPGPGDINGDGNIALEDHEALTEALSGPGLIPTVPVPACLEWYLVAFDLDEDADVDVADFAVFQRMFTGAP